MTACRDHRGGPAPICITAGPLLDQHVPAIDAIFFAASATQTFASERERQAFRERWLGRYLDHYPQMTLVAIDPSNQVIGYLVGASDDPARNPLFADIAYFAELADLTLSFPAHLHINLDARARGQGIGANLVRVFCAQLARVGVPGVHVVTSTASRNRSFYARLGFQPLRTVVSKGGSIVMLGRGVNGGLGEQA